MVDWAEQNTDLWRENTELWANGKLVNVFVFVNETDAAAFKVAWGGD